MIPVSQFVWAIFFCLEREREMMEKEKKSQGAGDTDFVLQWGSTKRLRCVKVKKAQNLANKSKLNDSLPRKKLTSRAVTSEKEFPSRLIK